MLDKIIEEVIERREESLKRRDEKKEKIPLRLSENAIKVLEKRYLRRNTEGKIIETPEELFERVARSIAEAEKNYGGNPEEWEEKFYNIMVKKEFMPNSPTLMNAGTEIGQLSACFVLPVGDSMEDIFETIKHTAIIHKTGGGTGFSFSRLRPKDDVVKTTGGIASGPISFMTVFDAATEVIKQGGKRRGANMGILRVDHPDIMEFITSKDSEHKLNNFNISVAITDKFMEALFKDEEYELINPRTKKVVKKLKAREVFTKIVEQAWKNGEPGVIFIDRINEKNPTPHIGMIESTNPCGEQPLLPYESCNLGSINLSAFVRESGREKFIDYERLGEVVEISVRFLDDVIDCNKFPIEEIKKMTLSNRKIGLGVMGFADMLIKLGIPYDSEEALKCAEEVMSFIQRKGYETSSRLAEERGVFPNFKGSIWDKMGMKMRNATVTTIAPTGTISIIAECSSGIEPLFALVFFRQVLDNEKLQEVHPLFIEVAKREGFYSDSLMAEVMEKGSVKDIKGIPEKWREVFKIALEIPAESHVKMQAAFQKYTDNAVSKTINFPNSATVDDVARAFLLAYKLNCKGITIYRDGSRSVQVLNVGTVEKKDKSEGPSRVPRPRPEVIIGETRRMKTGCGNLYVTINEDSEGLFEVFAAMGKAGGCAASQSEAICRLISLALRAGVDTDSIIKQLRGIRCPVPMWNSDGKMVLSCADAIAQAMEKYLEKKGKKVIENMNGKYRILKNQLYGADKIVATCPECGGTMEPEEGCFLCRACGFSKCF